MPRRAKLTKTRTGVVPASGGWFVAHALRALPRAHEARVHRRGPRPPRDPDGGGEAARGGGHPSGGAPWGTGRGWGGRGWGWRRDGARPGLEGRGQNLRGRTPRSPTVPR